MSFDGLAAWCSRCKLALWVPWFPAVCPQCKGHVLPRPNYL